MRAVFTTDIGDCAVAWNEAGLTRFWLPTAGAEPGDAGVMPPEIARLVDRVRAHLRGDFQDFSGERYDFSSQPEFQAKVLRATLTIPAGQTRSYGDLSVQIGATTAASRSVGTALGRNSWPLLIPCHRVVASDGRMTGFSGPGGIATKLKLLALEGAQLFAL